MSSVTEQQEPWNVWTIPNLLSILRIIGAPIFYWLIVGPNEYGWALALLIVSSATDWIDGLLARLLNQFSRFGEIIDPIADRLYIVAALAALWQRNIVPTWVVAVLVSRDVFMVLYLKYLRRYGVSRFGVHFPGKAATLCLLYALPLILLGNLDDSWNHFAHNAGWAFLIWGVAMYIYAAALYVHQGSNHVRERRRVA